MSLNQSAVAMGAYNSESSAGRCVDFSSSLIFMSHFMGLPRVSMPSGIFWSALSYSWKPYFCNHASTFDLSASACLSVIAME